MVTCFSPRRGALCRDHDVPVLQSSPSGHTEQIVKRVGGASKVAIGQDVHKVPLSDNYSHPVILHGYSLSSELTEGRSKTADAVCEAMVVLPIVVARQVLIQVGEIVVDQNGLDGVLDE